MPGVEDHKASVQPYTTVWRGTSLIVVSAICFGAISILTLLVIRAGTPLVPAMLWRYVAATLVMAGVVAIRRPPWPGTRRSLALAALGGGGQAGITYLSLRALDYIPVGATAFLFYTYPAWVTLVAALRGVDRLNGRRALALVLALAGVTIIVGSSSSTTLDPAGVVLALGAAISYGVYLPTVSTAQRGADPLVSATLVIAGAAVAFGAAAIAFRTTVVDVSARAAIGIAVLALVSTVGAFWFLLAGLAVLGPVRTAIVATVEPFVTTVLAVAFIGDRLSARTVAGGGLIVTAVIVLLRSTRTARADTGPLSPGSADHSG